MQRNLIRTPLIIKDGNLLHAIFTSADFQKDFKICVPTTPIQKSVSAID